MGFSRQEYWSGLPCLPPGDRSHPGIELASPVAPALQVDSLPLLLVLKNPPTNAGNVRDPGSIPGLGRSPGGGHGNPLQYSCLENPVDRGTWRATELDTTEVTECA